MPDRADPANRRRPGESAGAAALAEFHRQRMACFVREVKDAADPEVFEELRFREPELLTGVIDGRGIGWAALEEARHPLVGASKERPLSERQRAAARRRDALQSREQAEWEASGVAEGLAAELAAIMAAATALGAAPAGVDGFA